MDDIIITKAGLEHIDDLMVVENLSFRIPWSRQAIIEEITKNKFALYWCSVAGSRTIGYAGMWHICDEGHITNIAVHPEFRGIGVGSSLMETLISEANRLEIAAMTLEVRKSNAPAIALYTKYGFESCGIRKAYYADNNEDAIIMWKKLGNAD